MTAKFIIPGTLPSINDYIDTRRGNRYDASKMKKFTDLCIVSAIKKQMAKIHFTRTVSIDYTWVEPNRKRDKDNISSAKKFINDSLQKAGNSATTERQAECNRRGTDGAAAAESGLRANQRGGKGKAQAGDIKRACGKRVKKPTNQRRTILINNDAWKKIAEEAA